MITLLAILLCLGYLAFLLVLFTLFSRVAHLLENRARRDLPELAPRLLADLTFDADNKRWLGRELEPLFVYEVRTAPWLALSADILCKTTRDSWCLVRVLRPYFWRSTWRFGDLLPLHRPADFLRGKPELLDRYFPSPPLPLA